MEGHIYVLESDDYREEIEELKADPIIRTMANELPPDWRLRFTHPGDKPNWDFMCRAGDEYKMRGGELQKSIGGPARAIIALRKERAS